MSKRIHILNSDGLGGQLLGATICRVLTGSGTDTILHSFVRDEIFKPLKYLLNDHIYCAQEDPNLGPKIPYLTTEELVSVLKINESAPEFYFTDPDCLYRSQYGFDYKRWGISPEFIKAQRILTHKWKPVYNKIYVGLATTTKGYMYENIGALLRKLGRENKDYQFYFPLVTHWDNTPIHYGDLNGLPDNIIVAENKSFIENIDELSTCFLSLHSCNGTSHISHHLGQSRIILDPQFGRNAWIARWKENYSDSIPISSSVSDVAKLVKTLLDYPETVLLPRMNVVEGNYRNVSWPQELLLKYAART